MSGDWRPDRCASVVHRSRISARDADELGRGQLAQSIPRARQFVPQLARLQAALQVTAASTRSRWNGFSITSAAPFRIASTTFCDRAVAGQDDHVGGSSGPATQRGDARTGRRRRACCRSSRTTSKDFWCSRCCAASRRWPRLDREAPSACRNARRPSRMPAPRRRRPGHGRSAGKVELIHRSHTRGLGEASARTGAYGDPTSLSRGTLRQMASVRLLVTPGESARFPNAQRGPRAVGGLARSENEPVGASAGPRVSQNADGADLSDF